MKFPIPEELQVLVLLADEMREGLERFGIRRPTILNAASIIISVVIHIFGVIHVLLIEGVTKREVGGVPWHGILHRLYIKLKSRDREVLRCALSHCIVHNAILLGLCLTDVYRILEPHVLIQRIVLGCCLLTII